MASKGYTIAFLINEVKTKLKSSNISPLSVAHTLSPNKGLNSVKIEALNTFIGNFTGVVNGKGKYAGYGKTPKTRLLKALKLRKKLGFYS